VIELRTGFGATLVADTLSSSISAGSPSTSVIQLDAVEIAKWARQDVVNVTGAGATVANNWRTTRITNVDTALNRVTVSPALAIAPAAGNLLRGGVKEWCVDDPQATGSPYVRYQKPRYSAPIGALLDSERVACIVFFGPQARLHRVAQADMQRWELRAISRHLGWAEGLAARMRKLFHGVPTALTVPAVAVTDLLAGEAEERSRDDELAEYVVVVAASFAEVAA